MSVYCWKLTIFAICELEDLHELSVYPDASGFIDSGVAAQADDGFATINDVMWYG